MKSRVYTEKNQQSVKCQPMPIILNSRDAIVRIIKTTNCRTDLHGSKGREGLGIVESVGKTVFTFNTGDKVLISGMSTCGKCKCCQKILQCSCNMQEQGDTLDGIQAEFVRIPFADTRLYPIPHGMDDDVFTLLSDIFPVGFNSTASNEKVTLGGRIAIVGAGSIGLAALLTVQCYSPTEIIVIDLDDGRLATAEKFGATMTINNSDGQAAKKVLLQTLNGGVDTSIETIGVPATFELCKKITASCGHIANIGMHGNKVNLYLEWLWKRNLKITEKFIETLSTPMLLNILRAQKHVAQLRREHRLPLNTLNLCQY